MLEAKENLGSMGSMPLSCCFGCGKPIFDRWGDTFHIFTLMLISAFIFHLFMSSDTNTDADIHWTRFLLTVLDKQWHTECVRCHTCGDLLDHKCFFRSRLPLFKLIISPYQGCAPPREKGCPALAKERGQN